MAPPGTVVLTISTGDPGGTAPINLTGNEGSQSLTGNAGDNIINGGSGGDDTMAGLGGNDTFLVRGPGDLVLENNGEGFDTVFVTISYSLGANEVEVLSTVIHLDQTPIDLIGNYTTQTIIGNYGSNVLNGGSGGLDTLMGLDGNDVYAVGDSRVVVIESAGQGFDTVVASVDYALPTGASVEVLAAQNRSGTQALVLAGNEQAQTIAGNDGANTIDGGGGADLLVGGGGADLFRFSSILGTGNIDSLADFEAGVDRIGLTTDVFAGLSGGVTAASFANGASATNADQRILYDQTTGRIFYDSDGSGAAAPILFALVTPGIVLAAASFEIIPPPAMI